MKTKLLSVDNIVCIVAFLAILSVVTYIFVDIAIKVINGTILPY